jgi:hypothetical protein
MAEAFQQIFTIPPFLYKSSINGENLQTATGDDGYRLMVPGPAASVIICRRASPRKIKKIWAVKI